MATANSYVSIVKFNKNPDGTLTVTGVAADDSIDLDDQICDPAWLNKAMPDWFKSGGNIREQHSQIAAGVANDYRVKGTTHEITALVVDPSSVRKVETGVLKGFSVGIRNPRVIRDATAKNGRIVDGQIVEVSLVDRPANPNAKLVLAKSVKGELVQVEELAAFPTPKTVRKYSEDQERDESGRFGSGGGGSSEGSESQGQSSGEASSEMGRNLQARLENGTISDGMMEGQQQTAESNASNPRFNPETQSALREASTHLQEARSALEEGDIDAAAESYSAAGQSFERSLETMGEMLSNSALPEVRTIAGHASFINGHLSGQKSLGVIRKYSEDQERDESGRFGSGGGASSAGDGEEETSAGGSLNDEIAGQQDALTAAMADVPSRHVAHDTVMQAKNELSRAKSEPKRDQKVQAMARARGLLGTAAQQLRETGDRGAARNLDRRVTSLRNLDADMKRGTKAASSNEKGRIMAQVKDLTRIVKSLTADRVKFDQAAYDSARTAIAQLIMAEAQEMQAGHDELNDLQTLLGAAQSLIGWYESEVAQGEVPNPVQMPGEEVLPTEEEPLEIEVEGLAEGEPVEGEEAPVAEEKPVSEEAPAEEEKEALPEGDQLGDGDKPGADEETVDGKADEEHAEGETCPECGEELKMCKCNKDAAAKAVDAIVAKAVKSAKAAVLKELDAMEAANKAALAEVESLQAELTKAKAAAAAGGPKRGRLKVHSKDAEEFSLQAAAYKAKAAATTDPLLAKGYTDIAEDLLRKAALAN